MEPGAWNWELHQILRRSTHILH